MNPGKLLIALGGLLIAAGLLFLVAERLPFRLGRLPGDFVWRGRNSTVYFPLATSILLSVLLTLLFSLWRKK